MDTLKSAAEYRLGQWGQVMQCRTSQGVSIKDYCANAGISRNTYFYYYNIVVGRARQPAVALFHFIA